MQFQLNKQQKQAVTHKNGPLLIIAGAGTGKTEVVTQRILHIIEQDWAKSSEILALTFTEKAANEMLERVDVAMPMGYEQIWISTFHSFCDRILREEGHYIGLDTNYVLMSVAQTYMLFRQHLYDFNLKKLRPAGNPTSLIDSILKHFSRLQDEDITPDEYLEYVKNLKHKSKADKEEVAESLELALAYKKFTKIKLQNSRLDFGDLIVLTLKLLRAKPNVLQKYHKKFKYILVDEFQDTNYTQNVLVNILSLGYDFEGKAAYVKAGIKENASKNANLTVVGDDDQAIYKFRGAAISNIMQFQDVYPTAKKVVLTQNYRSNQEILDVAYGLIQNNNPHRLEIEVGIDKNLKAMSEPKIAVKPTDAVQLFVSKTGAEEASKVIGEILKLTGHSREFPDVSLDGKNSMEYDSSGQAELFNNSADDRLGNIEKGGLSTDSSKNESYYDFADIAILVRAYSHVNDFVQELRYRGIPYKFTGSHGLYHSQEITPLISFLKLLVDPTDSISLYNILRMESLEIQPRDIVEITHSAKSKKLSILERLEDLWNIKLGTDGVTNESVRSQVAEQTDSSQSGNFQPASFQTETLIESPSSNLVKKTFTQSGLVGITNVLTLLHHAQYEMKRGTSIGSILLEFFKGSGYLAQLEDDTLPELEQYQNEKKIRNISKYFDTIKRYEEESGHSNLFEYIEYLNYSMETGDEPSVANTDSDDYNAVNIMTVHKAKGLEFPVVFMVNLAADRFPSRNRTDKFPLKDTLIKEQLADFEDPHQEYLAEERRLFYVGITRTQERLYLTCAKRYGDAKRDKKPSIFLDEIVQRKTDSQTIAKIRDDSNFAAKRGSDAKVYENGVKSTNSEDKRFAVTHTQQVTDDLAIFNDINFNLGRKVSFSQLNSYKWCPKKYRYSYVLKLPTEQSVALSFGSTIHNVLQTFYERLRDSEAGLPGFVEKPDLQTLLTLYKRKWISKGYDSQEAENARKKQGEKALRLFYKTFYTGDENVLDIERWVKYNLDDIVINGRIDRVDLVSEDESDDSPESHQEKKPGSQTEKHVQIIDYKTGKVKDVNAEQSMQLALYTLVLEEKLHYKVDSAQFMYVEHGEVVEADISKANQNAVKKWIKETVGCIREGKFKAEPNAWKCKMCEYRTICQEAAK